MEKGFVKGDSSNLPKIDALMVANYFATSSDFCSSEYRNIKTSVSSRESYGDDAIGYVQLCRNAGLCTIKSRICPEHKVRAKPYNVSLVVNENEGKVMDVQCHDCVASQGGCKHAVAFLLWLHRRSEEPSSTSRECYWKKPKLAQVGSTLKYVRIKEISTSNHQLPRIENNQVVLAEFLCQARQQNLDNCHLIKHQPEYEPSGAKKFSMHYLLSKFNEQNDCNIFLYLIKDIITEDHIKKIENDTKEQSENDLWYELKYGRISASIAYEVSKCNTPDGTLVSKIMGGRTPDMPAMKRGRILENKVREEVGKILKTKINKCGLFLYKDNQVLAASPDGIINNETLIEIKCPTSNQTVKNYIQEGKVTEKYYCQVQMQMHITGIKKCYVCIADISFETNRKVQIIEVEYNEMYSRNIILCLINFWKENIYPLLHQSARVTY